MWRKYYKNYYDAVNTMRATLSVGGFWNDRSVWHVY